MEIINLNIYKSMKKNYLIFEISEYSGLLKLLQIMKIGIFLLLITVIQSFAVESYSQKTLINLDMRHVTIEYVLTQIESQSEFYFLYSPKIIDVKKEVSIEVKDKPINEVLPKLFAGTDVKYMVIDRQIVLGPGLPENVSSQQQPRTREITGTVKDKAGQPLVGVTILIKGTTEGTITDIIGNFRLDVPTDAKILVLSFIGMRTQEVDITDLTNITVEMEEDAIGLEEVVAVGYGTVKRSDLTGSVASVKTDELLNVPVTNINQVLQGRVSGVQIRQTNNAPGGDMNIRVRGINSYMGSSSPLYVIDGVVGGDINTINPSDIQSLEILKDASSTAIYGANGANGVVLITTKSGILEKSSISFNSHFGWQKIAKKVELLNAYEWAEIDNIRSGLLGLTPVWDLNNLPADTDWYDEVYNVAPVQNYNLSSSGGQKVRYYAAANYINQEGIIDNTDYQRYSFRINLDSDISDRIKIGSRLAISRFKNNRMVDEDNINDKSPSSWVLQLAPVLSPYDENGNLLPELALPLPTGGTKYVMNPIHYQKNLIDREYNTGISGSVFAEIELLKGLVFRPSVNYVLGGTKDGFYKSSTMFNTSSGYRNSAKVSSSDSYKWHTDMILNYQNSFGNGHNLNLLGGFIAMKSYSESINATVEDFALDIFEYHALSAGATKTSVGSGLNEKKELAYISRINYNYQGKYLFTFNSRYDGSSIFGIDNKWGFFPSAAVAWKLSEEQFIKDLGLFYNLKLRASYGISGSEALGAYSSHSRLSSFNAYNFAGVQQVGFRPTSLAVPDLQWEEVAQLDIGLESSFLDGRIGFTLDYYQKETSKLFLSVPVPRTSGVSSVTRNTGNIENKGFEIVINTVISDGEFGWRSDLNLAFQDQVVTNLGNVEEILLTPMDEGGVTQIKVGQPLGCFYGFKEDGIWQIDDLAGLTVLPKLYGNDVKAGDLRYVDQNNDGDVNDLDRVVIGKALPKFFGGWNNTFNFKNFNASVFFDYVYGNDIFNADHYENLAPVTNSNNKLKEFKNYWTPENPSTTVPSLTSAMGVYYSDGLWIEDGSYIRLREVSLGYSLPSQMLTKVRISALNIFVSATNLFTLTKYTGNNIDINAAGNTPGILNLEYGGYPTFKTFTTGINITF